MVRVASLRVRNILTVFWACGLAVPGPALSQGTVPHPRDFLGFTPGDDFRIADFGQLRGYYEALAKASPRVRLSSAGKTRAGNDILVLIISSVQNLERVERYREIAHRMARPRGLSPTDARTLAREGRAIVWIDAGLHAAETAHAQHAPLLAFKVATGESDEMRWIRDNVILVLLPCVNPDGLNLVADWYRQTVHTPHQDSPMPWLFNEYVGYENNRDFFAQTQLETQIVSELLYGEWLPQVMYNHHQGFYPTRIFVPPFPDPFNPNIDPGVIRGIELVGAVMQHRFEREGKDGVISRYGFSSWYNGSLRTTTYFHNMVGILTETTHDTPSPFDYDPAAMPEQLSNGWSTRHPSTNYSRPWRGGTLRFRDAIDYMLTGSMGVLEASAKFREELLYGMYQMASRQIALGESEAPVAYVIPQAQHDGPVAAKFLEILMRGGVEVHRAEESFTADGRRFPAGTHVVLLAQPFRPFVKDLLEPQRYPDIRAYPGGPPVPPYDNAGWTLSYQMGVEAVPIETSFEAKLTLLEEFPTRSGVATGTPEFGWVLDPRTNNTFVAVNRLLQAGARVSRSPDSLRLGGTTVPPGAFLVESANREHMRGLITELGVDARGLARRPQGRLHEVTRPRIGVYQSWVVEWVDGWTAAEGWTRFVLDTHEFTYERIHNRDVRAGDLRTKFDVIVIPNQDVGDIVGGYRAGRRQFGVAHQNLPPPEYQGGIEEDGVAALRTFVDEGGTLLLVDRAAELATRYFDLPVQEVLKGIPENEFFGPGSIVTIETDVAHPVAWGMTGSGAGYFRKSRAYESDDPRVQTVVRYGTGDLLMSGWLLGAEHMVGKAAVIDVKLGKGRVVLYGFSPTFRAWPHGTFKLFFNALMPANSRARRAME